MSPITSTPAWRAISTLQCGAGWVSGAPGVRISAAKFCQDALRRSAVVKPACAALATLSALSSAATTSAPPAFNAWQLASPEPPRPNTATVLPAKEVTGIMNRSAQLQRGEAGERQHHRDDPEADHDLRLGPALLLEMMVQRRHHEYALARHLERHHLHDDGNRLDDEQPADHREHDLVLHRHRRGAQHAAERQRAGVAHEDRGRRRVEPEEAETRAKHRAADHRELAGAGDVIDLQIVGEYGVAREVGDHAETGGRDHHGNNRETIEAVGEIHRIAGADDDEGAKDDEEPAEIDHELLEEGNRQRGRRDIAAEPHQQIA